MLSKRLETVAGFVRGSHAADVGSDHALLTLHLVSNGIVQTAEAADINEMPYRISKKAVEQSGLYEKIAVRKGNGLEPLTVVAGTCVIAGMGGMLTVEILKKCPEKAKGFERLVLQPQHDIAEVRKYLTENGFKIVDEAMLTEDEKFYNIICAEPGIQAPPYSLEELKFGRILISKKDECLKKYIETEAERNDKVLAELNSLKCPTVSSQIRAKELEAQKMIFRKVLNCL